MQTQIKKAKMSPEEMEAMQAWGSRLVLTRMNKGDLMTELTIVYRVTASRHVGRRIATDAYEFETEAEAGACYAWWRPRKNLVTLSMELVKTLAEKYDKYAFDGFDMYNGSNCR